MITIKQTGNFHNIERFLSGAQRLRLQSILNNYGRRGVAALSSATPKDTGETASSWKFKISITRNGYTISWYNDHEEDGIMPAILIQYGHATGTGGYVQGIDYINPAMKPIFNDFADDIQKEVSKL